MISPKTFADTIVEKFGITRSSRVPAFTSVKLDFFQLKSPMPMGVYGVVKI